MAGPRTLRLAHRGDWRNATENSLAAFAAALVLPACDGLELDVRASADGVPVINHDATLARVHGRPERIDAMTAAALGVLGVPTLREVLASVGRRAFLDVELKGDPGAAVVEVLAAGRGPGLENAVVSSFDRAALARVARLAPAWPRWLNAAWLDPASLAAAADLGCRAVALDWRAIDEATMERARAAGLEVAAYTVRRRSTYDRLARLGVIAGSVRKRGPSMADRADLVIVGAGTVGGWASVFARAAGIGRVVVVERGLVGSGASSRAAGIVRAQGGTPATVALGLWSIDFYNGQQAAYGCDSGFRELGYLILAMTEDDERAGRERVAMQRAEGLDVTWLDAEEAAATAVTLAPHGHRGGSFIATDGAIDPPRNVRAYSLAMQAAGVELRERTSFTGIRTIAAPDGGRRVVAVETDAGVLETERVLLTGGPNLREVGRRAGVRIPVGAARHTVAVLEPHPAFDVLRMPMVFDIGAGLYWRLEEGGLLFGWSDPDELPGEARRIDWSFYDAMRARLGGLVPVTTDLGLRKIWVATIDYTPDHLPIVGPGLDAAGRPIAGLTVASPGGHGMMWGPGVARVAADLVTRGASDIVDVSDLGLDRFDAQGRSRLASDPIALPFPVAASDDPEM